MDHLCGKNVVQNRINEDGSQNDRVEVCSETETCLVLHFPFLSLKFTINSFIFVNKMKTDNPDFETRHSRRL